MRRHHFIAFALVAGVAACAVAQSSSSTSKPHHARVHHPRAHHAAPPANPEAKARERAMKQESARQTHSSRTATEGKKSLKSEKRANSARKAESTRAARTHRRQRVKPHSAKKHHASSSTVGKNRLEMERRQTNESKVGYEEGFRAGFAAGLAARRGEAESAGGVPSSSESGSKTLASRSTEAVPEPTTQTHISDATVRSTTPVSGNGMPGGDVPTAAMERSHSRPETTALQLPGDTHVTPLSLKASLHLFHEPAPGPLRGTLASLERQNRRLDEEGLQRVEDKRDLEYRIARKLLVPVPVSDGLAINPGLPADRRFCRPWTANFLMDLSRMHQAVFHKSLRVDSAVRTVKYQRRLIAVNANAAPAVGDVASPHETGAAVDIAKRGMTAREIGWMRRYLLALQTAGLIDVEEEFYQSCFHITVYHTYGQRGVPREAGTGRDDDGDHASEAAAPSGLRG